MSRIEKLTAAQIARFPEFVERWTKIGLCTEPADRPEAKAAIAECYRQAGLKPPQKIIWCGSPLSQGLTRAVILDKPEASVGASVGASVRDSVRASVWASVGASVGASVRDSVWASVRASVEASVWASVGDSVGDSVEASVRASVGDSVEASVYSQHDASWLAFYEFFAEVLGLTQQTVKLKGLWRLAKSAGWALPHQSICWMSERHNFLNRDERGQLHSLTGPACAFPDGWSIYAVHGVRVPEAWIEHRDKLDPAEVLKVSNVEQRSAGCAIIGWPKMMSQLERKIIDGDPSTDIGALIELSLPGLPEPGRFLQAVCPRNGTIVEGVPRVSDIDGKPIETVIAAQAWRDGLPAVEYQHPLYRT